jgi:hypothetical protein
MRHSEFDAEFLLLNLIDENWMTGSRLLPMLPVRSVTHVPGPDPGEAVEPMGFEPTTFPVSPGRAHQPLDHRTILPRLKLPLATHGFRSGLVGLLIQ